MPIVTMPAKEMHGGEVAYISLVQRGANRIPFKIVKKEKPIMLDLDNLGSFLVNKGQKQATDPVIVGIATMKGASLESVKKHVQDAGFKVDDVVNNADGSLIFKQESLEGGEHTLVTLNDSVSLVVKGFRPFSMESEDSSLSELVNSQMVFPGVSTVLDVVRDVVFDTLRASDSPSDAAAKVNALFSEAAVLVTKLMGEIPEKAFKLDQSMIGVDHSVAKTEPVKADAVVTKAEGTPEAETKPEAVVKAGEEEAVTKAPKKPKVEAEEELDANGKPIKPKPKAKKDDGGDDDGDLVPAVTTKADVEALVAASMADVTSSLAAMVTKMGEIQTATKADSATVLEAVNGTNTQLGALEERVKLAEGKAEEATTAIKGSLVPGADDSDPTTVVPINKSSGFGRGGNEFDTAINPRVRKKAGRRS